MKANQCVLRVGKELWSMRKRRKRRKLEEEESTV